MWQYNIIWKIFFYIHQNLTYMLQSQDLYIHIIEYNSYFIGEGSHTSILAKLRG